MRNHNGRPANGKRTSTTRAKAEREVERFRARPLRPTEPGLHPKGRLLIIGGHEDKTGDRLILRTLAKRVGSGKLVVSAVATEHPEESWREYEAVFRGLGVRHVHRLSVESRADGESARSLRTLEGATAVFFTGGDQLRITSVLGDTPVYSRVLEIFLQGGTIAGTSAGASMMSETMIVGGGQNGSHRIAAGLQMAPGLGFAKDMVIDQHFAERGRISRLLAAVAQNPRILGIGIDENTAIELVPFDHFRVVGDGAVYVVDGSTVTQTNVAEEEQDRTMSVYNTTVHVMTQGDRLLLETRTPRSGAAREVEDELGLTTA
jgi:cyanophycinase